MVKAFSTILLALICPSLFGCSGGSGSSDYFSRLSQGDFLKQNKDTTVNSDFYIQRHINAPDVYLQSRPIAIQSIVEQHPGKTPLVVIEHVVGGSWGSPHDYEVVAISKADARTLPRAVYVKVTEEPPLVVPVDGVMWNAVLDAVDNVFSTSYDLTRTKNSMLGRSSLLFVSYWNGTSWRSVVHRYPGDYFTSWDSGYDIEILDDELAGIFDDAIRRSVQQRHVANLLLLVRSFHAIRVNVPMLSRLVDQDVSIEEPSVFE